MRRCKMAVITIRGQLGSGAPEIGKILANRLNYEYVDRKIIESVSSRTNYSKREILMKERPAGTLPGRIIESLNQTYPVALAREGAYVPGWEFPLADWKYLKSLKLIIKEIADKGYVVIRGRGSQFILKNHPNTLHLLTVAPLKLRITRVMNALNVEEKVAIKKIMDFDSSRREFIKRYFKAAIENPINYDLVLNTQKIEYSDAAGLIACALSLKKSNNFVRV
jgi:cytidylate kinase